MSLHRCFQISLFSLFILGACSPAANQQQEPENKPVPTHMHSASEQKLNVDLSALATNKDLVCGMPLTEGVADTASYQGKKYGFCSEDCKKEFLKAPATYLTQQ